jgi:predicted CoA-binding protein
MAIPRRAVHMTTRTLLQDCRTIAVVGLSPDESRDSHRISRYMQAQGYRIIPINPRASHILGEAAFPDLATAAMQHRIDLVNCFRRSEDIPPIAREAAAIHARGLWLQLGIEHEEAAQWARAQGLDVVQNCCIKVEHARLKTQGLLSVEGKSGPATIAG